MPRIFDNIDLQLLPALKETLQLANRADFYVEYFNHRGCKQLDSYIEKWSGGKDNCCRLLVGMQRLPQTCYYRTESYNAGRGDRQPGWGDPI